MNPAVWLLAALALMLWPTARTGRHGAARYLRSRREHAGAQIGRGPDAVAGRPKGRVLVLGGALAPAALAVAALGPSHGLPVAALAAPAGLALTQWLRRRPSASAPDRSLPLTLDLVAAVLRSGRPVHAALTLAAPAAGPDVRAAVERTARLLALGADPQTAWGHAGDGSPGHPHLGSALAPVAEVAVRSHASGARLAAAFERLATELRLEGSTAAVARARRAGVHALGPLAACFLPSFVCLGIVPVVVGIASDVLRTVGS